jgi:hypothetical protein
MAQGSRSVVPLLLAPRLCPVLLVDLHQNISPARSPRRRSREASRSRNQLSRSSTARRVRIGSALSDRRVRGNVGQLRKSWPSAAMGRPDLGTVTRTTDSPSVACTPWLPPSRSSPGPGSHLIDKADPRSPHSGREHLQDHVDAALDNEWLKNQRVTLLGETVMDFMT